MTLPVGFSFCCRESRAAALSEYSGEALLRSSSQSRSSGTVVDYVNDQRGFASNGLSCCAGWAGRLGRYVVCCAAGKAP